MKPLSYNIKALRDLKPLVCLYAEMHTVCDSRKTDVALRICWPRLSTSSLATTQAAVTQPNARTQQTHLMLHDGPGLNTPYLSPNKIPSNRLVVPREFSHVEQPHVYGPRRRGRPVSCFALLLTKLTR